MIPPGVNSTVEADLLIECDVLLDLPRATIPANKRRNQILTSVRQYASSTVLPWILKLDNKNVVYGKGRMKVSLSDVKRKVFANSKKRSNNKQSILRKDIKSYWKNRRK